jgi:hypothetical protein
VLAILLADAREAATRAASRLYSALVIDGQPAARARALVAILADAPTLPPPSELRALAASWRRVPA